METKNPTYRRVEELLGETGWTLASEGSVLDGEVVRLKVLATHEDFPPQRADSYKELVRRCWWIEDHR